MKQYLLLRDNRESGPHALEELASIGLRPLDLIWVENESTSWNYPGEMEELKTLVQYNEEVSSQKKPSAKNEKVFIAFPSNSDQKNSQINGQLKLQGDNEMEPVLKTNYCRPLEELKEDYEAFRHKKPIWSKRMVPSANAGSVAAVVLGVMFGAFLIKKWVDGYVPNTTETTAVAVPVIDRETEPKDNRNFKNALVTEVVPVYKNIKPKKASKLGNIKKQLKVKTNDYKVGLFGGIDGLQLTVLNTSSQFVDKVIVVLDYLKPNGAVVQSENILFSSIKPNGSQTISIPGSSRGVKVRYKILKIYPHDYKTDLKQV